MYEPGAISAPRSDATARNAVPRAGVVVAMVVVSHTVVDTYTAFVTPLLPLIMDNLGISITLAATLATVLWVSTGLPQPVFGYLADRFGKRAFIAAGPLMAGIFFSLAGLAPSYLVLLLLIVLGGLGSAAFHPPSASLVARAGKGRSSGKLVALFSFGGAAGFAAGPVIAVALVGFVGLGGLWIAMVPGVVLGTLLWFVVKGQARQRAEGPPPPPRKALGLLKGPLGLVFVISASGAFAQKTIVTFIPIIAGHAGESALTGAAVLSVFLGAQGLGTLASGFLADRVNRQRLLAAVSAIAVPVHILAIVLPPATPAAIAMAAIAGCLNMALLPPVVVMAQDILPSGTAAMSGTVMGMAWAAGALGIPVVGVFADMFGPVTATAWAMPALLAGTVCAMQPALKPYSRARRAA